MAIDKWLTVTIDAAASSKPDNMDHRHKVTGAGADAGDVTFAYDSAKITSVSLALSVMAQIQRALLGRLPQ